MKGKKVFEKKSKSGSYAGITGFAVAAAMGLVFAIVYSQMIIMIHLHYPEMAKSDLTWFRVLVLSTVALVIISGFVIYFILQTSAEQERLIGFEQMSAGARTAENQQQIIKSFSTMYYYSCLVDVAENSFQEMLPMDFVSYLLGDNGKFNVAFRHFIQETVVEENRDKLEEFGNLSNLEQRMADSKYLTCEFISSYMGWSRCYLFPVERDAEKKISKVLVCLQKIENEKKQELKIQEALNSALESAKAANIAKTEFLSRMSHDIRTPMNGIVGMTTLAQTRLDDKARVKYCLDRISESSTHLLALINDVLDMSRIETGRLDLQPEKFSLSDLMDNLVTIIHPQTDARMQRFICDVINVEHEKVIGDATRLEEVFLNLASNAVKYTPEGGLIKISVYEKFLKNGTAGFEFKIEDNGIGMSEEFQQHLFEPFSREYNNNTKHIAGTGLGLAIARNIITMMGGEMNIVSTAGKGTTVSATFCMKIQEDTVQEYSIFRNIRILVVDDNSISCEANCSMLRSIGMRAESAYGGKEAIQMALTACEIGDPYKFALVDWRMPEVDGIMTIASIQEKLGENAPVFAIFAYDWTDIEVEARRLGVKAFISKPLFKSRVVSALHQMADHRFEEVHEEVVRKFRLQDYGGRRALLVEDNELNTEIAVELLKMTGIEVETACDGAEAVEMVSDHGSEYYDIIFMDIQMPKMNGYDATKAIRSLPISDAKTLPIIAMTANAFLSDVQQAKNSGMSEHISKPIDINKIREVMSKWL